MQAILEQNLAGERVEGKYSDTFGKKIGFFASLLGCWHKALSRPFTNKAASYRA